MKRFMLVGLAVVLIAIGTASAWFFFLKAKPDDHGREQHETVGRPDFLEVESLSVPVIRDGRVQRYILLRLTLELRDGASKQLIQNAMPLVKDAYLRDLHGYFADQPPEREGIDLGQVKARLIRVSDQMFGPGRVVNVLIQGAFEREWKPQ